MLLPAIKLTSCVRFQKSYYTNVLLTLYFWNSYQVKYIHVWYDWTRKSKV